MFTSLSTSFLGQIVSHTPVWVWGLLAVLAYFGIKQLATQRMKLKRVAIMPMAMTGLSLFGTLSAFGATPAVLLAWLAGLCATGYLVTRRPAPQGASYDAASNTFNVPGSAVPMALMMSIFMLKYSVGVTMAMAPAMKMNPALGLSVGLAYGAFSGIFGGRAWRLLRLALRHHGVIRPGTVSNDSTSSVTTQVAA